MWTAPLLNLVAEYLFIFQLFDRLRFFNIDQELGEGGVKDLVKICLSTYNVNAQVMYLINYIHMFVKMLLIKSSSGIIELFA